MFNKLVSKQKKKKSLQHNPTKCHQYKFSVKYPRTSTNNKMPRKLQLLASQILQENTPQGCEALKIYRE